MRGFCLEVTGEHACFTRPELKVERVSYDVPTPSAARAIFDAILWKPAIFWRITKIEVLSPIRFISVRRNEVGKVASAGSSGFFIEDERQQRAGLLLRDVKYRFYAEFQFIPPSERPKMIRQAPDWLYDLEEVELLEQVKVRPDEKEAKYAAMFERRAKKGQYFHHPYLGCREFPAEFRLIPDPAAEPAMIPEELKAKRNLGWMFYDMDFSDRKNPTPLFYCPVMEKGAIEVPDRNSKEVKR